MNKPKIISSAHFVAVLLFLLELLVSRQQLCHAELGSALDIGKMYTGTVLSVIDGDSLLVVHDGQEWNLRLFGIDAPEYDQPGAHLARKKLDRLVTGQRVSFMVMDHDRYGRIVAQVLTGSVHVNEELIRAGVAWVYPRYCKIPSCDRWLDLQKKAQDERFGIWQQKRPIPPWQWKRAKQRNS